MKSVALTRAVGHVCAAVAAQRPAAARRIASAERSMSASVVVALETDTRISRRPRHVVPGHGDPIGGDYALEVLTETARALRFLHDAVVERMNAGQWPDEIVDADIALPDDLASKRFLRPIYGCRQFVVRDADKLARLELAGQLVLRYAADGDQSDYNPNGSAGDVAGMCDTTGRVFGLMPHPERHIDPTHHPQWTRLPRRNEGDGLAVFKNAVRYFS